jgi:outer membrane protein OmpA-like peptidoglycan-associated protein
MSSARPGFKASWVWLLVWHGVASSACMRTARPTVEVDLAHGVRSVATDIGQQLGPAGHGSRTLVIDPLLDGRTGQQTHGSERVQLELAKLLPVTVNQVKILPFDDAGAAQSRLVITGTLSALEQPDHYRVSVALSDRQSGLVVAQSAAAFHEAGLDASPTRFYVDSPSLVRDRSVEGYLRTTQTPAGQAADALYIEQLPTAALLAEALAAYNAERWEDALKHYEAAVKRQDGQQLRTFNGMYLSYVQLGRMSEAEDAFSKIAALGLATNNLAVKLLFRPGATEFWPDAKLSGAYPMWLRQIAHAAQASGNCLNVVGHTSRSGGEALNDRLSLARAVVIRNWLDREAVGLGRKSKVQGVGSRENIVGSGADDASDAIDRRVEFKVVPCEG